MTTSFITAMTHDTEAGTLRMKMYGSMAPGEAWYEVEGRDCTITVESRPYYCDRGNWLAKLHPTGALALEVDEADGWPRYYFDKKRMFEEIGAWLLKRGQMPR